MEENEALLSRTGTKSLTDYLALSHAIEQEIRAHPPSKHTLKLAFLTSFTVKALTEIMRVESYTEGIAVDVYLGGYNQYAQEILDQKSGLYGFNPDLIVIFIDTRSLMGDFYLLPYYLTEQQRKDWVDEKYAHLLALIRHVKESSHAHILLHNFTPPLHSPLGILENKQPFGCVESIQTLNARLREAAKNDPRLFLFDYDAFCSDVGKRAVIDEKMYYLADMRISWELMPALCRAYLGYIKPLLSMSRKCIVLDLDNTLWGGIIGEDGLDSLAVGPTPEGRPFMEFQQYLLSLLQRGVLLAINSRNNPEDALQVFRQHEYMVLKENHFASIQINWNDKIANLKQIAAEINIGLDSLVFIDDDPANRALVRNALPEVLVVDLPADPALYVTTIAGLNEFNTLQLTEEDLKRTTSYAAQRLRTEFKATTNLEEYLHGLATVLMIEPIESHSIPRISQLTQRTNQFNMTGRRYQEDQIKRLVATGRFHIWSCGVKDRFGDYGVIAAIIVEQTDSATWRIDNFLMSCRVIGRRIEDGIISFAVQEAIRRGIVTLRGECILSDKNAPAKGFYERCGFTARGKEQDTETWEYDTKKGFVSPDCLQTIIKGTT
jgi:FkbH-like protein